MSIKKQLKKERSKNKKIIGFSIVIMVIMPYMVVILNNEGLFSGWEIYFAFFYAAFVDLLLLYNIIRINTDENYEFYLENQKLKVREGIFKSTFSINTNKILYVDISKKSIDDFEVLIVMEKGKKNKNFFDFNAHYVKKDGDYRNTYNHLVNMYPNKEFYSFILKKTGSKKYYYLYMLYKNCYNATFSTRAMGYVKRFIDEYNL